MSSSTVTTPVIDPRPTVEAPDDDPYLWLEEVHGERALAWVAGQNQATLGLYADADYEADRDSLTAILDRPDNIPYVTRRGGLLYNFWKDAAHRRGLWRWTTLASYVTEAPAWEVLLDLDALAVAEGEDWVWGGAASRAPDHARALVRLSRGGGDSAVLREFDLDARRFVPDGFVLPAAKGGGVWLDADTVLLVSAFGDGMATDAGYARTVRLWRRGVDPMAASVVFEAAAGSMSVWADHERLDDRIVYGEQTGFYDAKVWIGDRAGPRDRVDLPTDAAPQWHRGWLTVRLRSPWSVGVTAYEADMVLAIQLQAFLDGERDFRVLFQPEQRRTLQGCFWCGDRFVISVLDNLRPDYVVFAPDEGWRVSVPAGLPPIGTVDVWPLDADEDEANGELLMVAQTPVEPPALLLTDTGGRQPVLLKRAPAAFDATGIVVSQHEAVSADGERIPYVQIGKPSGLGEAPVCMTGYGGFRISMLPRYATSMGKIWIERGGTLVIANLRGGGEFGTRWHEAGRHAGKIRSHDDFAAVAGDLVERGVTKPGRIAATGGSNGGLLIANMLTRYPERFGALFCSVPLIDMRRYHRLLAGASWIAEYGDPDVAEDWAYLRTMSAYHVAEPGRAYPPILFATTRTDDRVHPGHARKMAAKLQALGYDARFHELAGGGHGGGRDNAEVAAFTALAVAYLRRMIGWVDGLAAPS